REHGSGRDSPAPGRSPRQPRKRRAMTIDTLFDGLVERLEFIAKRDPAVQVFSRTPAVYALGRNGNMLTVAKGDGQPRLLFGELKYRYKPDHGEDKDQPWAFKL